MLTLWVVVSALAAAPSTCPPLPAVTPAGTRLVIDTSESMKGFAGRKTVENFHRAIEGALDAMEARTPFTRCLAGVKLDCEKAPKSAAEYDGAKLYRGWSRLDLALGAPPMIDGCPAPDPVDAAKITLIVTDGVQVAATSSIKNADAASPECAEGPNPACVKAMLGKRIASGMSVSIAVLYLPFSGEHFPEIAVTAPMWNETEEHRKQLRVDPLFMGKIPADAGFDFKKPKLDLAATGSFKVIGFKPLVLIALSKDAALLSTFFSQVQSKATSFGVLSAPNIFETVQVAPLPAPAIKAGALTRLPGPKADAVKLGTASRDKTGALVIPITCERDGAAELRLPLAGPFEARAGPVTRTLAVEPRGGALPSTIASAFMPDGSAFKIGVKCLQLPAGKSFDARFALVSKSAPATETDLWWRALSTNKAYVMPERVFGLAEIVAGLLEQQALQPAVADEVVLRLTRP